MIKNGSFDKNGNLVRPKKEKYDKQLAEIKKKRRKLYQKLLNDRRELI